MTGSRDIGATAAAAAAAPVIRPVLLLKLEFDGGDVCLHSLIGTIAFGGDTYTGVGILGSVTAADEVSDLSSAAISYSLSGLPNELVSVLLNEQYQGRRGTLFLGYLDAVTESLVDTPAVLHRGLMDTADFQIDQQFAITLTVGNRFAAWDSPRVRRYNNADQQSRYPGDTGLQYIEQTTNKTIIWGAAS